MLDHSIDYANTLDEAISRYKLHKRVDPFPHILPALLSSAQIQAYIAKTGMVFPYFPSKDPGKERVTSASLTMTVGPEVLYWDSEGKQYYRKNLKELEIITLRPNSITFLRPAERFNIPDYIAVRFNLRIVHVHRGLLLGTGPLIDPGYRGWPMIPVHNLTENEYVIRVGDEFINAEFTKIICDINYRYDQQIQVANLAFEYKENKGKTCDFDFTQYIDKNVPQRKVKSSLSSVIDKATSLVERQRKISYGSIIAAFLAIATAIYGGYQLTISATSIIDDARERIDVTKKQEVKLEELQKAINGLQQQITDIRQHRGVTEGSVLIHPPEKPGDKSRSKIEPDSKTVKK
jgi:deoxycytidine triphosphate deaminase